MDARDPRWFDLFQEFFLKGGDSVDEDDLLFFVRQAQYDDSSVFVRRRVGSTMPKLEDVVDWKGTFWLNLVVHLPCRLTVTVCQRQSVSQDASGDRPSLDTEQRTGGSDATNRKKTVMRAIRRNSRKVFATPFKSNMQLKDTGHEPSFPLVYYAVNNFEDANLHLDIQQNEWLCVELAAILPKDATIGATAVDEDSFYDLAEDASGLSPDLYTPFPCPPWGTKIVFFQGAASFTALSQVFLEKLSGNALGKAQLALFGKGDEADRKEYIIMRGPRGKGQCEVAVEDGNARPKGKESGLPTKGTGSGSVFDRIRRQLVSTVASSLASTADPDALVLRSSLTYINIHFAFVGGDLLQWGRDVTIASIQ
ncbi:hypothetical protein DFJ74DRAFT_669878 [Hyaloraphidium curvatum]|nr:hypothetical protein DFJ74DRAFT_669878 [Hyaloraphidium curvatum]